MTVGKRVIMGFISVSAVVLGFGGVAAAHVVVKPAEALTGSYQIFTMGVPSEKDQATVAMRLDIPSQVQSVTPTVAPGWTIVVDREGTGEDATVQSITWTGGEIGSGLRGEFSFSAKTPDDATNLHWKAYQTYADGSVVSWDKTATGTDNESESSGPFSVTKVTAAPVTNTVTNTTAQDTHRSATRAQTLSLLALGFSLLSFAVVTRHQNKR